MLKKLFFHLAIALVILPCPGKTSSLKSPSSPTTLSAYFENDTVFGTDRDYTNGIRFSYAAAHVPFASPAFTEKMHALIDRIPVVGEGTQDRLFALSFGQNIYTNETTLSRDYLPEERPYAGLTYLGFALMKRCAWTLSTWEIGLGLVGQYSLAEDSQRLIHEWRGWDQPKGWQHQLDNEPVLQLFYNRKWLLASQEGPYGLGADFIPRVEWGVGNAFTYAGWGGEIRFGWNLPKDFGNGHIRPTTETHLPVDPEDPRLKPPLQRIGLHGFVGISGAFVARNLLLDGNTFSDSARVSRDPWTGDVSWGIGIIIHRFKILYARIHKSREYKTQKERQSYGTINISYTW